MTLHPWEDVVQDGALRRVAELPADARHAIEGMLGRPLREDEALSVNVYKPAPRGAVREGISRRLLERIDKTAKKVEGVPEAEIDAAIDEAVDYVRHHPE
jgi:hypothetical protein